ncbi:hypothetical protein OG250_09895 [Streptomyces sp. NBC_00487]|uniref:hypothetical protein n=1 Tax=unclassified Streptomyces TaxID=2593676 RepID=UPI002E18DBDE|nr:MULTISPECIES: hypothetical protein [unclassified Streptomyces]
MGKFRLPVGSPLQLLLLACSFALAGYAGVRLLADDWFEVALWFVGAAVVHDLVLLPLYAAADRALVRTVASAGHGTVASAGHRVGAPPAPARQRGRAAYVRVPAALSGLLLVVWFPLISGRVADRYESATALSASGFLARWLLITALLFGGSALLLVVRLRRATKERPPVA